MPLAALDDLSAFPSGRLENGEEDEEGEEEEDEHYNQKKKKKTQEQKKMQKQKQKKQQQEEKDLLPWCRKPRSRRPQYVQEGTETRRMVRKDPVCWQAEAAHQAGKRGDAVRQGVSYKWGEGVRLGELQKGRREKLPPTGPGVLLHTDFTTSGQDWPSDSCPPLWPPGKVRNTGKQR